MLSFVVIVIYYYKDTFVCLNKPTTNPRSLTELILIVNLLIVQEYFHIIYRSVEGLWLPFLPLCLKNCLFCIDVKTAKELCIRPCFILLQRATL